MKNEDFIKVLSYLGAAYGKEYTQAEAEQHYDFLNGYSYETFKRAVQSIIRSSKFLPKISELIDACDKNKEMLQFEIINYMQIQGYFKHPSEVDKATKFLETGNVPEWFREDMKRYYRMMNAASLESNNQILIGG